METKTYSFLLPVELNEKLTKYANSKFISKSAAIKEILSERLFS